METQVVKSRKREYRLRAAAVYSDAGNRLRNSATWDKEDQQYKEQIAAKQKAVDAAKQQLAALEEQARRSGVPANFVFPTGVTNVTYVATDAAGNTATGIQHVTVLESPAIRPTITECVRPPTSLKLPRVPVKRPNVLNVAMLYARFGSEKLMCL